MTWYNKTMAKFRHPNGTVADYPDHFVGTRVVSHLEYLNFNPEFIEPPVEFNDDEEEYEEDYINE